MRYVALASDYDGTLAHDGRVDSPTIKALERLRHSGRKLILVTGRELPELESVFPELNLFDRVVAENGALLYTPASRESKRLAEPPPPSFVDDLRKRGVSALSVGEVIVATWRPYEAQCMEAIRDAGLELQIIFNKDAVMILPGGVNKSTGLCAALEDLKLSRHNVVGVGDAENDHAFLDSCEVSVAVSNAIPSLKEKATLVTNGARGAGVAELIEKLVTDDLAELSDRFRDCIPVGKLHEQQVSLPCYGENLLVCGQSGSGKSTFVLGLVERIIKNKYQLCLMDPEGDYEGIEGCRTIGDEKHAPSVAELLQVLDDAGPSVVVNLVGVPARDRAGCFSSFISAMQELRMRTGRPHWLVIDEAHHVLPSEWAPASSELTEQFCNLILITVHPEHTSPVALKRMSAVAVIGREPQKLFDEFAGVAGSSSPQVPERDLERGEAAIWFRDQNRLLFGIKTEPSRTEHHRHKRKYAEGKLEEERMFRFRGPDGKVNLPADNLIHFVQLAEGIDADTWEFHRHRNDYSRWFRSSLHDEEMAAEIEGLENEMSLDESASRQKIKDVILQKYTAPA